MLNSKLKHLAKHTIQQSLHPDTDKEQWMAYQVLKVKYPHLQCQSNNGYHCEGLVDFKRGLVFRDNTITDALSEDVLLTLEESFYNLNTSEIVTAWMRVCGETETTKSSWLSKVF